MEIDRRKFLEQGYLVLREVIAREQLEQLRALWHGIRIHVELAQQIPPYGGIDTMADLNHAEQLLQRL